MKIFNCKFLFPLLLISFTVLTLFTQQAGAQSKEITVYGDQMDVTFSERLQHSDASSVIVNREGSVELMLTETDFVIQFSENGLARIGEEISNEPNDSHFAAVIKSMLSSGVRTLLDRAMLVPFYEIRDISYSSGKLIILTLDGRELFEDLTVGDTRVMEDFSRRDARRFVADAERLLP